MLRAVNGTLVLLFAVAMSTAAAAPIMHVHDSSGQLGTVDVQSGDVNLIGSMGEVMTDIAFDPDGNLFGVSFSGFYSIDALTADITFIGAHGISGANALVFDTDGTMYAAGSSNPNLYTLDPTSAAAAVVGNMGVTSGGDLAFNNGNFYLADGSSRLVEVNPATGASTVIGSFGVSNVFGLATGGDGQLYGVGGTSIFDVDVSTGAASNVRSFAGGGLGTAFGQSFFTEAGADPGDNPTAVPEPGSLSLLLAAAFALLGLNRRRLFA